MSDITIALKVYIKDFFVNQLHRSLNQILTRRVTILHRKHNRQPIKTLGWNEGETYVVILIVICDVRFIKWNLKWNYCLILRYNIVIDLKFHFRSSTADKKLRSERHRPDRHLKVWMHLFFHIKDDVWHLFPTCCVYLSLEFICCVVL